MSLSDLNTEEALQRIRAAAADAKEQARIFELLPQRLQRDLITDELSDEEYDAFKEHLSEELSAKVDSWLDDDTCSVGSDKSYKTLLEMCGRRGERIKELEKQVEQLRKDQRRIDEEREKELARVADNAINLYI